MASNLFGYRHRFIKEEMRDFGGRGRPKTHKFLKAEKKTDTDTLDDDDQPKELKELLELEFN